MLNLVLAQAFQFDLECVVRLAIATGMGATIGLERERKKQPAGFRTHTIICVATTLIMILSHKIAGDRFDPGRIAAQVVSGIGFLGAGAIMRMGPNVKGLTTAATIWTVAALGLAIGAGLYFEAVVVWAILFAALYLFSKFEKRFLATKAGENTLSVSAMDTPGVVGRLTEVLDQYQAKMISIAINRNAAEGKIEIITQLVIPKETNLQVIVAGLQEVPGMQEIEFH